MAVGRKVKVALIIIAVIVAVRLALPYFVTRYVNKVLSELPGYRGQIYDVDLALIRGAYRIDSLRIFKVNGNKEIPFVNIPVTDLSIEWESLMKGKVVGEIHFSEPILNFIAGKDEEDQQKGKTPASQTGSDVDWTEPIKKLFPFNINHLTIRNGKIAFYDFTTEPKVDLFLHQLQLDAQNLNNASKSDELLPSRVLLQARSIGNGMLTATAKMNLLKQVPDLDVDLKFENVDLKSLNDFFGAYAKIDVEEGSFNLYSEIAVKDSRIQGYVKPLLNNLKVVDWKKDKKEPLKLVWESIAGVVIEVFENQRKDQFATRVPLEGKIASVEAPFWPTLWNIFRNAFVEAFEQNTDNTINIITSGEEAGEQPATEDKKLKRKQRREQRREDRRARREERKNRDKGNP